MPRRPLVRWPGAGVSAKLAPAVLGALLLGGGAYAIARGLAWGDRRWVAPTLLSSSDARVWQVETALQQENARRDELALRKQAFEAQLREAETWLELEQSFQKSFRATLRADLAGQRSELRRLQTMLAERTAAQAVSSPATEGIAAAQPDGANTTQMLRQRIDGVRERVRVLEAASREGMAPNSYSGLAVRREYDRSLAASDQAQAATEALRKALRSVDATLDQKETLIASIEASPYHLAAHGDVALGFVPYDNPLQPGDTLVACKVGSVVCHSVGTVGEPVAGEVRATNPRTGEETRGQLTRLLLCDAASATLPVLYAEPGK